MRPSPLDLDEETMRKLGHRVTDMVTRHLSTLRDQPVIASAPRRELNAALSSAAPAEPIAFENLIATLEEHVFPFHAREVHPGFLAYIPSCPTFPAVVGDWIATGYNFFAGVWPVAAGPNEIEVVVLDWFREWMGMPAESSGLLTSGGSAANLTAVVAARHAAIEAGADISRLTVYTSAQAHSSVTRAAWIAGIPRDNVRTVPMDRGYRMRISDLARAIEEDRNQGMSPFMVIASAGTTNTGAVDPLPLIADVCAQEKLWLHVDAAYAGFAALTDEGRAMLRGIERADSLTLDPHKWLFVPFECGCLMVRDPAKLTSAFRILPEYLKDVQPGEEEFNFADRGEQLTRYSRALKIWMSVSYFGTNALADEIRAAMMRARLLEELVRSSPDFEILSPAQFGIVCFRAVGELGDNPSDVDALNERINTRVSGEGRFLISSTRLDGMFSLRMCTLGFRTRMDDIRQFFASVESALAAERVAR
ncbi:MAG TPA: aminotransferase class I/II-fold pyridoxal phosphate-dependent enzyme [Gemmatimonadaceae bacterium]|nr:aminotransferase class I/II-fold pyridoxal phosphate-dependent enzyme [Gemmatimonadaceae bacterium]